LLLLSIVDGAGQAAVEVEQLSLSYSLLKEATT